MCAMWRSVWGYRVLNPRTWKKLGERHGPDSSSEPLEATLILNFWSPELRENTFLLFQATRAT